MDPVNPSRCPKRLVNMDGPMRPRSASLVDFQFGVVATETIEDALLHLAQQNEQAVREASGQLGRFREPQIVGAAAGPGSWVLGRLGLVSFRHRP